MVDFSYTKCKEKNILGQIHCFTSAEYLLTPEAHLMLKGRKHLLKPHAGLRLELSAPTKREAKWNLCLGLQGTVQKVEGLFSIVEED